MSVSLHKIDHIKFVQKPWGYERWLADEESGLPYILKEIRIYAPYRSSLQFHVCKKETAWIQEGSGFLHMSSIDIDVEKYKKGISCDQDFRDAVASVYSVPIRAGDVFHIPPGTIHRVDAVEDILLIEASTTEVDDVIRLEDDDNRPSGKIEDEHK